MKLRYTLLNWILNKTLGIINEADILQVHKNGKITLGKDQITEKEIKNLQAEIITFKKFRLYGIIFNTVKQKALEKALYESTDFEQVLSGKLILHTVGLQNSIIELIEKLGK